MGDGSLRLGYGQGRAGKGPTLGKRYRKVDTSGQAKGKPTRMRIVLQTLTARVGPKGEETPTPGLPETGATSRP